MLRYKRFGLWIAIVFLFASLLSTTKKEPQVLKGAETFYFRFKLNGKPKDFSSAIADYQKGTFFGPFVRRSKSTLFPDTVYQMDLTSVRRETGEGLILFMYDKIPISTGVYKDNELFYEGLIRGQLAYQPPGGGLSYQSGGFFKVMVADDDVDSLDRQYNKLYSDSTAVTITELSETTVKGSFYGKLYRYTNSERPPSPDSCITISEGTFYLPIK